MNNMKETTEITVTPLSNGWQIAWGVLLIISGFLAMLVPEIAALATTLFFAWLLVFCGVFEIAYAIQTRTNGGFGWKLASGILTLLLGAAIMVAPDVGIKSLALLVGAFLLISGVTRMMLAFQLKPYRGWSWLLFDGLLSTALAILIVIGWPQSSFEIIGLLTGFTLVSAGIWRIVLGQLLPEHRFRIKVFIKR